MNPLQSIRRATHLWQEHRFERSSFYRGIAVSQVDAIFIIGCGRSGTTLLRAMLERHPRLWGGPESWVFVHTIDPVILAWKFSTDPAQTRALLKSSTSAVEFSERYFGKCTTDAGKARWIEKTPRHVNCLGYLLASFPNARFIHMIRDGRDVACSLRNHPKAAISRNGVTPITVNNPIAKCINRWVHDTSAGLAYRGHPRVCEIRYEQLVLQSEIALRQVCAFISEDFTADLLDAAIDPRNDTAASQERAPSNLASFESVNTKSLGRWQRDLSAAELATCMRVGGPLLEALGYFTRDDSHAADRQRLA